MDLSPLDMPPEDGLARAFQLPTDVAADPEWSALYEEMVRRLRTEALGIPMTTAQTLLIERIATKYVLIRYREQNGWEGRNAEPVANAQWLDLVKEWNRLLAASHEKLREGLMREVEEISAEAVNIIPDKETRQAVRRLFNEKYAALGY